MRLLRMGAPLGAGTMTWEGYRAAPMNTSTVALPVRLPALARIVVPWLAYKMRGELSDSTGNCFGGLSNNGSSLASDGLGKS